MRILKILTAAQLFCAVFLCGELWGKRIKAAFRIGEALFPGRLEGNAGGDSALAEARREPRFDFETYDRGRIRSRNPTMISRQMIPGTYGRAVQRDMGIGAQEKGFIG